MNKCIECNKIFTSTYLLNKHENKKNSCLYDRQHEIQEVINKLNQMIVKNDELSLNSLTSSCKYCKNNYSNKYNLKKHININCNKRNEIKIKINSIKQELLDIEKKIKSLKNDQNENLYLLDKEQLIQKISQIEGNNTNNNITNNNTNNNIMINNNTINIHITLNNYDKPNCDFLTIEEKNKFLKDKYKGVLDFIKYVYFNENYPENHTILISNLRSKFGQIYKDNKWIVEEIDEITDKINENSVDKLNDHLEELMQNEELAEKYKKEINKGLEFINHFTSNDTTKQSRSDIKKTLYNNRDIVMKTKSKIKK